MEDSSKPNASKITLADLAALNEEISSLIRAGVPLELGLREIGQDASEALRELTERLSERISAGASLVEALEAEGEGLPRVYRAVVQAGLRVGRLPEALESLTGLARAAEDLRQRIDLALLYPLIVLFLAYLLFISFLVFLVPELSETYAIFDLPVRGWLGLMRGMSATVSVWGPVLPGLAVAAIVWWAVRGRQAVMLEAGDAGPVANGGWLRWIPGLRNHVRANFAELLALLIEHGTPLPDALELAGATLGTAGLAADSGRVAERLRQGSSLKDGLSEAKRLPPLLRWMMIAGAQQGTLAGPLRHAAEVYRRRAVSEANWFRLVLPVAAVVIIVGGATLLPDPIPAFDGAVSPTDFGMREALDRQ
ncbi:MAG: type II secretory pathway, component PulF [Planctomycetes bacterium]|nr:type II secretory pathway, component PulF [Planctomycetota bacterium]